MRPNLRIVNEFIDQTGLSTGGGLPIAFAFNHKHDNLVMRINSEIQKMEKDGTLKQILQKVEAPSTVEVITTETPSSPAETKKEESSIEKILDSMEKENLEPALEPTVKKESEGQ